tara:strand:- start:1932 stop:2603 length:672 start_codon:yes stop_codon:yes gene_type:complete
MDSFILEIDRIVQGVAIFALPVTLAITLHEAAHAYVAKQYGDHTAYIQGRVTLNPLRHIDPIGTVCVPLLLLAVSSPYLFGWAKPVPINFNNLHNPKRDMLWVAAAGPAANLLMAFLWAIVFKFGVAIPESDFSEPMLLMGQAGILINVILLVLNLLPLPPLDGGRIAVSLLPHRIAYLFANIEPYGFIILLVLLFSGKLGEYIGPFILGTIHVIARVVGLQV